MGVRSSLQSSWRRTERRVKIILDEMMPMELGPFLAGHHVNHVIELGWRHVTNGKLLALSETNSFDVFITKDGNLPYQQNLSIRKIAVLVLRPRSQSIPSMIAMAPDIMRLIPTLAPGSVTLLAGS